MTDLFLDRGATFSPCRRYRYRLWRKWNYGRNCLFIMLNPSTADETANDPTVERCQRRAASMGFSSLTVTNLFALRSTDPKALYEEYKRGGNPIGPDNDRTILKAADDADLIICAWGTHGHISGRGTDVLIMLRANGFRPYALKLTSDGTPAHPLYLPYSLQPEPMS